MPTEQKFITSELKDKISVTVKSRQSLEMLLHEEGFEGNRESIQELLHTLLEIMGNRMTLEFIFSSHIAIWEEYRKMIDEDVWNLLARTGKFNWEHFTLLGTSLLHREDIKLGTSFLRQAAECADDVKSFTTIAEAVHVHLKDNKWAEDILIMAKEHCVDSEHYSKIAEAMVTIAEDKEMSITLFKEGISKIKVAHEYMEIATAIVRTLKDCKWGNEVFALHTTVPESGTPIEMLAEEAFQDEYKVICPIN